MDVLRPVYVCLHEVSTDNVRDMSAWQQHARLMNVSVFTLHIEDAACAVYSSALIAHICYQVEQLFLLAVV